MFAFVLTFVRVFLRLSLLLLRFSSMLFCSRHLFVSFEITLT